MKRFASIWLETFRIDRLRRENPAAVAADKPFALVESGARGIVVTAVNGAGAHEGLRAGLSLADARAILPGLLSRQGAPDKDAAALERLALWLGRYGPVRNTEGDDGLWVDITGVAHLFGGETGLAQDCLARLRGLGFTARLGIGDTRTGAFAMARCCAHECGFAIAPPGGMRAALKDVPVDGLQLGDDFTLLLRRLGLKRIGQLYGLPRAALERRFRDGGGEVRQGRRRGGKGSASRHAGLAQALVLRLDQALGELREAVAGVVEPPLFRTQKSYPEPLVSHDGIVAALEELAVALCDQLDARMMGARRVAFRVFRSDGDVASREVRTSRPVARARHVVDLFALRLDRIDVGLGVDAIVLEAFDCEPVEAEQVRWSGERGSSHGGDREAGMAALADRLANRLSDRFGRQAVYRVATRESHIPELAQAHVSVLADDARCQGEDGRAREVVGERPIFLFEPAERISVTAEVPDGPPVRFTWRRVSRRVLRAEGPERIAPEWWLRLEAWPGSRGRQAGAMAEMVAVPHPRWRTRDYYRVEDHYGAQYWVYRAGIYGAAADDDEAGKEPPVWFLQGVF